MARKVCKKCKIFVEKDKCSICGGNQFNDSWKGRITILNFEKSEIAGKMGITVNGEYVLKI
ncbi:DNA-directed RNA polymerase subunit E'' [Candidatus Woesearchaeota archaeon]|nr:DNA-directed RNA polymerase subunit E'' [Candidatus Woesearchaeota archaeon]